MWQGFQRDANAGIPYLKRDKFRALPMRREFYATGRRRKLHRILNDVEQYTPQLINVPAQRREIGQHLVTQFLTVYQPLNLLTHLVDQLRHIDCFYMQLDAPFVQAREGQQVRNQALHALDFGVHAAHKAAHGLLILRGWLCQAQR